MVVIGKVNIAWEEQVELRNQYKFAAVDVCLDSFAVLVKDTFEAIKYVKNQFIYNSLYPEDPYDVVSYFQLFSNIAQYSTYDYDGDESENYKFTATCLIAKKLVEYAIWSDGAMRKDGTLKFFDSEETLSGELVFLRADYPYRDDEVNDDIYRYNVYDGDFSEVLKLAKELAAV